MTNLLLDSVAYPVVLQWASASMYRAARECIDFPPLRIYYQERAATLSYASRVLAGVEAPPS